MPPSSGSRCLPPLSSSSRGACGGGGGRARKDFTFGLEGHIGALAQVLLKVRENDLLGLGGQLTHTFWISLSPILINTAWYGTRWQPTVSLGRPISTARMQGFGSKIDVSLESAGP